MKATFPVVLDANVIAQQLLCDFLLRLAEHPSLFAPKWSERLLLEMKTTQTERFKRPWSLESSEYMQSEMRKAFPEAMARERQDIERILTNHEKDRHVLATAIEGKASVICTYNLKDFPAAALDVYEVKAKHPSDFLIDLYTIDSGVLVDKLQKMAEKKKITPQALLIRLRKYVPEFCEHLTAALGWQEDE